MASKRVADRAVRAEGLVGLITAQFHKAFMQEVGSEQLNPDPGDGRAARGNGVGEQLELSAVVGCIGLGYVGALDGGPPMSPVDFNEWQYPLSLFKTVSCRFIKSLMSPVDFNKWQCPLLLIFECSILR